MQFVLRKSQPKFTPKMVHFGCFQLIKNYAETILLIDEENVPQEASYTAQQSFSRVESAKPCLRENIFA